MEEHLTSEESLGLEEALKAGSEDKQKPDELYSQQASENKDGEGDEEEVSDFTKLRDASVMFGSRKTNDGKVGKVFVYRNKEESEAVFRNIGGDITLTRIEGNKMSKGGFYSALAGIEDISLKEVKEDGTKWVKPKEQECLLAISELERIFAGQAPSALFGWPRKLRNRNPNVIGRLETILVNGLPERPTWHMKDVNDHFKLINSAEKMTLNEKLVCRTEARMAGHLINAKRPLKRRASECSALVHDLRQLNGILRGIKEKGFAARVRNLVLKARNLIQVLVDSDICEIENVEVEKLKQIEDGVQHIEETLRSVFSTASSTSPSLSSSSSTGLLGFQETVEKVLQISDNQLGHILKFFNDNNISIPEPLQSFKFKTKLNQRLKGKDMRHGCAARIWRRSFTNDKRILMHVVFGNENGKTLHGCGIEHRPNEKRVPAEVREKIAQLLHDKVPPKSIIDILRKQDDLSEETKHRLSTRLITNIRKSLLMKRGTLPQPHCDQDQHQHQDQETSPPPNKKQKPTDNKSNKSPVIN